MKWYGKIIFSNEGVETYAECDTESEARNFVNGFLWAQECTSNNDDFSLEDYSVCVDQIKPIDEAEPTAPEAVSEKK